MRTKKNHTREILPDPKYNSVDVTKFINRVMLEGKKTIAQKHVYNALEILAEKTGKEPLEAFQTALDSIKPKVEVRSRRVGGAAYQVPMPVRGNRQFSLAVRWLVTEANKRSNSEFRTFGAKLAAEMFDAINEQGGAFKKKIDTHKMADANKAFAHFRW